MSPKVKRHRHAIAGAAGNVGGVGRENGRGRHVRAGAGEVETGQAIDRRVGGGQIRAGGADEGHAGVSEEAEAHGQGIRDLEAGRDSLGHLHCQLVADDFTDGDIIARRRCLGSGDGDFTGAGYLMFRVAEPLEL